MFAESRIAYERHREDDVTIGPGWATSRLAAGACLVGGAFDAPSLGRIEPGAPADLTVLEYVPPTPLDAGNLAGHWIFGMSAAAVRDVIVAGELVIAGRRPTRVDAEAITARGREVAAHLWARLETIDTHPFDPAERAPWPT
jgi:cytosine/adenosine deaminase-related metal-dependent hydrolase